MASEFRYRKIRFNPNTLYIFVSQSGETADTAAALEIAKKNKMKTCSVINVVESSIARNSDWVVPIHAGPEIGVASTKAFIGQMLVLYIMSLKISKIRGNIDNKNYEASITIIDNLFEKLSEISGAEEFANKLDDLITIIDNDEVEEEKLISSSLETFNLFNKEVSWREDANKNLLPELMKYNEVIKNNIGLRRQSKLTKQQAKFVARCNSVHRDVSLNF